MTENFAQLFEESLQELETRPGSIVKGTVVSIDKDIVLVDAGIRNNLNYRVSLCRSVLPNSYSKTS